MFYYIEQIVCSLLILNSIVLIVAIRVDHKGNRIKYSHPYFNEGSQKLPSTERDSLIGFDFTTSRTNDNPLLEPSVEASDFHVTKQEPITSSSSIAPVYETLDGVKVERDIHRIPSPPLETDIEHDTNGNAFNGLKNIGGHLFGSGTERAISENSFDGIKGVGERIADGFFNILIRKPIAYRSPLNIINPLGIPTYSYSYHGPFAYGIPIKFGGIGN